VGEGFEAVPGGFFLNYHREIFPDLDDFQTCGDSES
jgi:hypothetical protein